MARRAKGLTEEEIAKLMQDLDYENFADSDSDLEMDELDKSVIENQQTENEDSTFSWETPKENDKYFVNILPFVGQVGLKDNVKCLSSEEEFFKIFFTEELLTFIVEETNRYAEQVLELKPIDFLSKKKHVTAWKQTNADEILKFFGLLLLMGHIDKDNITDYWTTNELTETPIFRKVMPRDRFVQILKFLHFEDNSKKEKRDAPNYDRLWKMRNIFEYLNNLFKSVYNPTEHLSIDEIIVKFKGRVQFKQYLPKKRKQWGIKVYKIADLTGYTYDMRIYLGKEKTQKKPSVPASYSLVYSMAECIKNKGHKLFMDNYFSSPELFSDLLKHKQINSCGTIRQNRRNFPKELVSSKKKPGDVVIKFCRGMTALCWKDKRDVYMLSNMHMPQKEFAERKNKKRKFEGEEANSSKPKETLPKPKIVADYNNHMGYVDLGDRMSTTYSLNRRTQKWTKKLFFHLLDLTVLNAFLLFKQNNCNQQVTHKEFRMNLISSLIGKHPQNPRPTVNNNSHWPFDEKKRRRCFVCKQNGLQRRSTVICRACNVALCVDKDCFMKYHTTSSNGINI